MHKHPHLRRTAALTMCAALALGSVPVSAADSGVTPTYDEAYYATTDYYGNLTEGSVVKSYRTNGIATVTDYGVYDEIVNLTDGTAPAMSENGKTVFQLEENNVPKTFYFEGKTARPFEELPWTISLHYAMNGVTMKAEDLAGQTGVAEITIDAIPNKAASAYAQNNYTLEAMAIFNQDDILSLEAPGAQVQLIGNLRAVLFIGLPGEECHFTIRVGSDDFAFGGMTFLMVPATLSQLEEIAKLSERKGDLEDNYNKLSGSMDALLDAMSAMTGSLNASASGLDKLERARGIFSNGKGTLYAGTDALRADLSNLADVLEPVEAQMTALSKTITDSKSILNSMVDTVSDLRDDLSDVEDALEDLEDGTGDVRRVLSSLGDLRRSLTALQNALGGSVAGGSTDSDQSGSAATVTATVSQVKKAHSAYVETDRGAFYQALLELKGTSGAAAAAASAVEAVEGLAAAQGVLTSLESALAAAADEAERAALQAQITTVAGQISALTAAITANGIDKLEVAYQGKAAMTFQTFCQQVLGQSAATAKQMNDLWLVYASGKVDYTDDDGTDTGNTPANGGTLSGTLLHNDPAPEGGGSDTDSDTTPGTDAPASDAPDDTPPASDAPADDTAADGTGGAADTPLEPSESVGGAVVDLIAGGLDSAMGEIAALQSSLAQVMNRLKTPTTQVIHDLAALCGRIEDLSGMIGDAEDLSAAARDASGDLRSILGDVEDLQDILNDYEPVLQESVKTVSDLSVSAVKTIRDTQSLVTDTEALMKSTGSALDSGTKQTLEGLAEVLRQTARTMAAAGEVKEAKSSLSEIIEDTWHEYTGETNNLLLMDATAEAVSMTDSRNAAPESIQVLIRTQEIRQSDDTAEETVTAQTAQTTFWGRVAQMFRDFWSAITGIFKGKD